MHDAGLHYGLGKHRGYRLGEALEPVNHRDQDVLDAAAAQFGHYPQPELRTFGLFDPNAENFLVPRATNADRQVSRPVANGALVADFYPDRVEEDDGVSRI